MQSSKNSKRQVVFSLILDTVLSASLLVYLIYSRDSLTPDFLHFVVCLGEEACHTIWALTMWFAFKRFYSPYTKAAFFGGETISNQLGSME